MFKRTVVVIGVAVIVVAAGAFIYKGNGTINWASLSNLLGLVTAAVSVIGLILQFLLSKQEQGSFRQQLIAVLHHAEGITDSLFTIETALKKENNLTTAASVEAVRRSAGDMQMGLMETKVGGKQLSDDLDNAYKEWAKLELKLRMAPLKQVLQDNNRRRDNPQIVTPLQGQPGAPTDP